MSCKEDLAREFEMKDMGLMHYFLCMEVWQKDGELFMSQGKYANEILRRFHIEKCKPMQTPLAGNWRKEDATAGDVVEAYRQLVDSLILCRDSIRLEEHIRSNFQPCVNYNFLVQQETESCIKLSENPVFHDKSKHIDILCHHIRDCVARRIMLLQYILIEEQDADILTKALSKCKFVFHRDKIGVADNPFLVEREC
eukprot:PITA_16218